MPFKIRIEGDYFEDENHKYTIISSVKTTDLVLVTASADGCFIHSVVMGDTLWNIAERYLGDGVRYREIMKLNGLKSNVINVGQKLKIPN